MGIPYIIDQLMRHLPASGTAMTSQQTPGIPDLMAFSELRGFAFIEVKTPEGVQSKAQRDFQEQCRIAGTTYVLGGIEAVRDWLGRKEAA